MIKSVVRTTALRNFSADILEYGAEFIDEVAGNKYWFCEKEDRCHIFISESGYGYVRVEFDFSLSDFIHTTDAVILGKYLSNITTSDEEFRTCHTTIAKNLYSKESIKMMCDFLYTSYPAEKASIVHLYEDDLGDSFSPELTDEQREAVENLFSKNVIAIFDTESCQVGFIDGSKIKDIFVHVDDLDFGEIKGEEIDLCKDVLWMPCNAQFYCDDSTVTFTTKAD